MTVPQGLRNLLAVILMLILMGPPHSPVFFLLWALPKLSNMITKGSDVISLFPLCLEWIFLGQMS